MTVIDDYLTWAAAAGHTTQTLASRSRALKRAEQMLGSLLSLNGEQISGYLAQDRLRQSTRCTYRTALAMFYRWALLTGRIDRDPMRTVGRPRPPRSIPRPAPSSVFRAIIADGTEPWTTAVLLASYAGLRSADVRRLRREDVDERVIRIYEGKGRRDAELPTHHSIWAHVKDRPAGLLVPRHDGSPFSAAATFAKGFTKYLERLGQPHVTVHQFRHLYATTLYRNTHDLLLVQQLMRHSSVASTVGYVALVDELKTAAVHAMDIS